MRSSIAVLLLTLSTPAAPQPPHHQRPDAPQVLAPGYSVLQFVAPKVGSYALPALGRAPDGELLDSTGTPTTLHALYGNRTVVLSFIFTACTDVNGCPLATFVLARIQEHLSADDELKDKVRLVSVSFDPATDTPEVMANYARSFRRGDADWRFLTAESEERLEPVLADYDQAVIRTREPDGRSTGAISHILRVYLIDPEKNIRNIYSPSFLHPDILLADIRTVTD